MAIIKRKNQRVGVFIDIQNLYHSAKMLYDARANFQNILKDAVEGRELIRAIAYVISTEGKEEKGFFDALFHLGIETRSKELIIFNDNSKKADWDIGIAVDMISMAPKLDNIILISGDGDFVPAIDYIKKLGCTVEVVAFSKSCASKLRECADDFIDLSLSPKKYIIKTRHEKI